MDQLERIKILDRQSRAFTEGTVEFINEQWVFFDKETEEASLIDEYIHEEVEIFLQNRWQKGILLDEGKINCNTETHCLKDHDRIRIRNKLIYSLELLLKQLNIDAFIQFISSLNSLQFSIYDCIYCYNQLSFLKERTRQNGVNFLVFDNQHLICSVQHHFCYGELESDRFEFTLNTGKRIIIEKISS
ncbi:DUF2777 domain-containing protein [Bacillus aquiflavi]|uniref:DUF2777 domain-containing protein n=1 Tax=Bacillus aquiflavi TaxID=2672567 RepID=A0A6B3W1L0_9BACI|nr:DUF2777 domain-containing protein [Bacillus aquiflavi]MBA4538771.1 DUF2777 domain-containing protein [Bacillus aquiflavi]NEY83122.1 DUF2777 domain-containing protein [Bacillus aquiflavi]UAC49041.1 DUF2777 domain-containing protein [Bacillus aquiflavi]